mmetsp:Transcript_19170/g.36701  ORF Transcript_19170/g.36701 Transcript_19170/m.36701 type:complete len:408 (-) Transcript_19170:219-1442(-)
MQYYTKQQLQGAGKYASPARMGNWNEDGCNDEHQLKDYLFKKEHGQLRLDVLRYRMQRALAPIVLTKIADDGYLHFGDLCQVGSCVSGAVLSIDTEDTDPRPGEHACAVSASQSLEPRVRNTFLLVKYIPPANPKGVLHAPTYNDELVHYGQHLHLVAHPQAFGLELDDKGGPDPWYVRSMPQSMNHFSKLTRHQEISATPRNSYHCVWQILDPNPANRPKLIGQPVQTGAPVLLEHCSTRQHLNCEEKMYWNDFGEEHEVTAHSTARFHRAQVMENVTNGCPISLVTKNQEDSNLWVFTTGTQVQRLNASEGLLKDKKKVLKKLLQQLSKMGANGFTALKKAFNEFDIDGSGSLNIEEFQKALAFVNICLTEHEAKVIMNCFDRDDSGSVGLEEFVTTLQAVDDML